MGTRQGLTVLLSWELGTGLVWALQMRFLILGTVGGSKVTFNRFGTGIIIGIHDAWIYLLLSVDVSMTPRTEVTIYVSHLDSQDTISCSYAPT